MTMMLTGGCQCGAVRYALAAMPERAHMSVNHWNNSPYTIKTSYGSGDKVSFSAIFPQQVVNRSAIAETPSLNTSPNDLGVGLTGGVSLAHNTATGQAKVSKGKKRINVDHSEYQRGFDGSIDVRHPTYGIDLLLHYKDGAWHFECDKIDPKPNEHPQHRKSTRTPDWFKACHVAKEFYESRHGKTVTTFADIKAEFMTAFKASKKDSEKTKTLMAWTLDRLLPFIGATPVDSRAWNKAMEDAEAALLVIATEKRKTNASIKLPGQHSESKNREAVRKVLKWAAKSLGLDLRMPDRSPTPKDRRAGLTPSEYDILMQFSAKRFASYHAGSRDGYGRRLFHYHMQFINHSSLRPEEALSTLIRDVDRTVTAKGYVKVYVRNPKPGTRKAGNLYAYADKAILSVIDDILTIHPDRDNPDAFLFMARPGNVKRRADGRIDCYKAAMASLLEALQEAQPNYPWLVNDAGEPRSLYCLRHGYATDRVYLKWSPFVLAESMGTSEEMVRKYYFHRDAARIEAMLPDAA